MSSVADFFQSKEFGEFQKKIPHRGKYWLVKQQDREVECLVIKIQLPMGFCWLWVPYGPPEYIADFLDRLGEIARRNRALFARIEPPQGTQPAPHAARRSPSRYTPEHSLILSLRHSNEVLLAQMKPKGRYNIKVAEKHGVEVKEFLDFESIPRKDFDAFYALLEATGERDTFGIHPKSYYEALLKHFGALHMSSLFLAYFKEKVVGGIIVIFYRDTALYYYGASDHSNRTVMAPYLLQWRAIQQAKDRGCLTYDFFGIAPALSKVDGPAPSPVEGPAPLHHPWSGVTAFKKKFGGSEVLYPAAFDIVYRPLLYKLFCLLKKIR